MMFNTQDAPKAVNNRAMELLKEELAEYKNELANGKGLGGRERERKREKFY
jgi:hypothetical protein